MCTVKSRSSHGRRCFGRKGVLGNLRKFAGKHLSQSHFFNKARPQPAFLLKKRLWHRCFSVKFAKFLKAPFLQNTSKRLFLQIHGTLHSTYLLNDKDYNTCFLIIWFDVLFVSFISIDLLILNSRGITYKVGNFHFLW